jgi:replicative DNA helicase
VAEQDEPQKFKIRPHSIEAEQAVLGGLMLDGRAWDQIADVISEADFYRPEHRLVFNVMLGLTANNNPVDLITVSERLESRKELEDVGGVTFLGEIAKNTPTSANIRAYAEIVRERSILRQLIDTGAEISGSAFDTKGRVAAELLDDAERKVFAIAERGGQGRGQGPRSIAEVFAQTVDKISEVMQSGEAITGMPTGFPDLDKLTSGFQASDLIVIAGRPAMGKTMLGLNVAENISIRSNKPVLIYSMEMPAYQLALRLMASLGRVELQKIRTGQLADLEWEKVTNCMSMIAEKKLYIDDTPALTPVEVRARARRLMREHGELGLIVVDYLQLMRFPGADNRANEIAEISRSLKALAKELDVPVIALSQLNRGLEQRQDKRPMMSDLRESGAIEQDADIIIFIYRDEVYNKESPEKGVAEIIIGKQRNGPIGTVRLTFRGQYARFDTFTAQQPPMPHQVKQHDKTTSHAY